MEPIKKKTEAEVVDHYKVGIKDLCLVCDSKLMGSWTDYNGQIYCSVCGMTYQIMGSHLREEFLSKHGLKKEDIAREYCDGFELVDLHKAYWKETGNPLPLGTYISDRRHYTQEDYDKWIAWIWGERARIQPEFAEYFNWEAIEGRMPTPAAGG